MYLHLGQENQRMNNLTNVWWNFFLFYTHTVHSLHFLEASVEDAMSPTSSWPFLLFTFLLLHQVSCYRYNTTALPAMSSSSGLGETYCVTSADTLNKAHLLCVTQNRGQKKERWPEKGVHQRGKDLLKTLWIFRFKILWHICLTSVWGDRYFVHSSVAPGQYLPLGFSPLPQVFFSPTTAAVIQIQ